MLKDTSKKTIFEVYPSRKAFFEHGMGTLGEKKLREVEEYLLQGIDERLRDAANPCVSLAFIVPSTYENTPLNEVWLQVGRQNYDTTRWWLGLLLMSLMINHEKSWITVRMQFEGRDVEQAVYFLEEHT